MNNQAQMRQGCPSQHLLRTPLPLLWAIPLLLVVAAPSCGDDDLKRVGRTLNEAARSIQVIQATIIEAHGAGLISGLHADDLVEITVSVAKAIGEANILTINFSRLDPEDRDDLIEILEPILLALQKGGANASLSDIADENLRASIKLAFEITITAIQSTRAIVEIN